MKHSDDHHLTDEQLMVMYQNGNSEAFRILYDRHSSKVYSFLKRRIQKEEKVMEIYQDVFVKIHRSKSLYNKAFPLLPWFFTITKSVMLDALKKEKSIKYDDPIDWDKIPASGEESEWEDQALDQARCLMKQLPEKQQQAIHMRYVDDKTFEEIADHLNTSSMNVRQLISRGIKRLKSILSEGEPS